MTNYFLKSECLVYGCSNPAYRYCVEGEYVFDSVDTGYCIFHCRCDINNIKKADSRKASTKNKKENGKRKN